MRHGTTNEAMLDKALAALYDVIAHLSPDWDAQNNDLYTATDLIEKVLYRWADARADEMARQGAKGYY